MRHLSEDFSLLEELRLHGFEMSARERIEWQSRRPPVVLSNNIVAHNLLASLPVPSLRTFSEPPARYMLKTATNATIVTEGEGLMTEIIEGSGKFKEPFVGEVKMHVVFGELCNARVFAVPPDLKYVDVNLNRMECLGSRNVYLKVCDFLLPLLAKHKRELERIARTLQSALGADWFRADVFFDSENVTVNDLEYPSNLEFEGDKDDRACIDTLLATYKRGDFVPSPTTTLVHVEQTTPSLPFGILLIFLCCALLRRRRRHEVKLP